MLIAKAIVFKFLLTFTYYHDNGSAITKFENDTLYKTEKDCEEAGKEKMKIDPKYSFYKCNKVNKEFYEGGDTN